MAEYVLAQTLARTLRKRRHELGLSQENVALSAGIDRTTYQLMESGKSDRSTNSLLNPHLFTLFALAQVLKIPLSELVEASAQAAMNAMQQGKINSQYR